MNDTENMRVNDRSPYKVNSLGLRALDVCQFLLVRMCTRSEEDRVDTPCTYCYTLL